MEITRQQRHGVSFYACSDPAWAGAGHGFSTRLGGVSPAPMDSLNLGANRGDDPVNVRENFVRFCAAAGTDPNALVKNHQIHSDIIRPVGRADVMEHPEAPGSFEADGLVTNESGVCLTIFSGDCIPILLYDPVRRCIAAVHAGWRGTAAGAGPRAAEAQVRDDRSAPGHPHPPPPPRPAPPPPPPPPGGGPPPPPPPPGRRKPWSGTTAVRRSTSWPPSGRASARAALRPTATFPTVCASGWGRTRSPSSAPCPGRASSPWI